MEELSDDQNPESEILRHVASLEGRLEAVKLAMGLTDRGALQGCQRISRVGPQGRFTISAYAVPQDIAGHVVFCGPLEEASLFAVASPPHVQVVVLTMEDPEASRRRTAASPNPPRPRLTAGV